jgi:hypothetical protein
MSEENSIKFLIEFSKNKGLAISNDEKSVEKIEEDLLIFLNEEKSHPSHNNIFKYPILKNDGKLFELIEFVFENLVNKKNIYIVGKDIEIYIFSVTFLRRWNKYSLEKSIEYIKSTIFLGKKLKIPLYVENQLKRYEPAISVLVCGARNLSYTFDKIIERELKKLPKKSIVYCGKSRGIDERTSELCKKLNIENEVFSFEDDDIKCLNLDMIYAFHEEIKNSQHTMKILHEGYHNKIEVYVFDLKSKEKFEGNKFIYVEYI